MANDIPNGRRRQEDRRTETRSLLLAAAAALFADHGVDSVSVDAVAVSAGRTSGAVYDHFGSKHGLLMALLDEWKHSLVGIIVAELDHAVGLEGRLAAVADNVIVNPSEETRRLLLLERELWLRAARDEEMAAALRSRARAAHLRMRRGFEEWIERGVLPGSSDPDLLASAFRAIVLGLELQQRIEGDLDTDQAVAALGMVLGITAAVTNA